MHEVAQLVSEQKQDTIFRRASCSACGLVAFIAGLGKKESIHYRWVGSCRLRSILTVGSSSITRDL